METDLEASLWIKGEEVFDTKEDQDKFFRKLYEDMKPELYENKRRRGRSEIRSWSDRIY